MGARTRILRGFRRLVGWLTRPRVRWSGPEARELLEKGGAVLVCDHNSITNGPMVLSAFPKQRLVPIVAKDWYEKKSLRPWLEAWGCIPCDRRGLDTQWLRAAMKALREGKSVLIFPEGRVRKDGVLNEFKPGAALLAAMSGAPVIPVSIGGRYTPVRPARLYVGRPVSLDRSKARSAPYLSEESERLRQTVMDGKVLASREQER